MLRQNKSETFMELKSKMLGSYRGVKKDKRERNNVDIMGWNFNSIGPRQSGEEINNEY